MTIYKNVTEWCIHSHENLYFVPYLANIFTYGSESTADSRTIWTDINPQAFSNCVDMVFVVDRTSSLNSYLPGFESIVTNLPTNGESCINRLVFRMKDYTLTPRELVTLDKIVFYRVLRARDEIIAYSLLL